MIRRIVFGLAVIKQISMLYPPRALYMLGVERRERQNRINDDGNANPSLPWPFINANTIIYPR